MNFRNARHSSSSSFRTSSTKRSPGDRESSQIIRVISGRDRVSDSSFASSLSSSRLAYSEYESLSVISLSLVKHRNYPWQLILRLVCAILRSPKYSGILRIV